MGMAKRFFEGEGRLGAVRKISTRACACTLGGAVAIGCAAMSQPSVAAYEACGIECAKDAGGITWVLSNGRISRTLRYEAEKGALRTLSLKDKASGMECLAPAGGRGEGSVSLHSPEPSTAMTLPSGAWRLSEVRPDGDWASPGYDDKSWRQVDLPFLSEETDKTWWFRRRFDVPKDFLGHLQLAFSNAIDDSAEIYVNGRKVASLGGDLKPWARTLVVDVGEDVAPGSVATLGVKLAGYGKPNGLSGSIQLLRTNMKPLDVEFGAKSKLIDSRTVELGDKGKELQLEFQLDSAPVRYVMAYRIYPGLHPWTSKRISLMNSGPLSYRIKGWTAEELSLSGGMDGKLTQNSLAGVVSKADWGPGLFCTIAHPRGSMRMESGILKIEDGREITLAPGSKVDGALATTGLYNGSVKTGFWTYRLFLAKDFAHTSPTKVPPVYNTWYGYTGGIDQRTCERIIPLASRIGCKCFVIDDGWQQSYGDWDTDKAKFPKDLSYIGKLCAGNGMKFGIWAAPTELREESRQKEVFKESLDLDADMKPARDGRKMCFASDAWADHFTGRMLRQIKESNVDFVKLDFFYFMENCFSGKHNHPAGDAIPYCIENWYKMVAAMRKANPAIVVDSVQGGSETLDAKDENWFGDWIIDGLPGQRELVSNWYINADDYRRVMWDVLWTYPGSAVAKEANCHMPGADASLFEYHTTSIAAYCGNLEVHGKLDEMTPQEEAIVSRWVRWNWENREFLQYSQHILGTPYKPAHKDRALEGTPAIDGIMHLRNLHKGKYGYICLWNPMLEEGSVSLDINPVEWYLSIDFPRLEIVSVKDGSKVAWEEKDGKLRIAKRTMKSRSWDIFELRANGGPQDAPDFLEAK